MTTPTWLTGFEPGVLSINGVGLFDVITGSPAVQGVTKRTGNFALQCLVSGSAATCYVTKSVSSTIIVDRFYFLYHTGTSVVTRIYRALTAAGSGPSIRFDPVDNKLEAYINSSGNKSAALSPDTWYRVDFKFDVSANPTTVDFQLNGSAVAQSTYAQAATTMNGLRIGINDAATGELYYDDIVVSYTGDDYPIGAGQVDALLPNGDGTHNNAANILEDTNGNDIDGTSVFAYSQLNTVPMSDTTTRIQQNGNGTANYVEVRFAPPGSYTAYHGVSAVLAYMAYSATGNNGGCLVRRSDATEITVWGAPGALADYSESSVFYKSVIVTAPAGGWTEGEIDALRARMGYSGDANPDPYWINLLIEVAHNATAPISGGQPTPVRTFGIPTSPAARPGRWN